MEYVLYGEYTIGQMHREVECVHHESESPGATTQPCRTPEEVSNHGHSHTPRVSSVKKYREYVHLVHELKCRQKLVILFYSS